MICVIISIIILIGLFLLNKDLKGTDKHVSYILMAILAGMSIYHMVLNQRKTEHFESDLDFESLKTIVSYLKGVSPLEVSKPENEMLLTDLQSKFGNFDPQKLEDQMNQINTLLSNLQNISGLVREPEKTAEAGDQASILETRNIRESQLMQDMEIKALEKELSDLQTLYKSVSEAKTQKEYKKIPVFSSCVMEANGSISQLDTSTSEVIAEEKGKGVDSVEQLIQGIAKGGISISLIGK